MNYIIAAIEGNRDLAPKFNSKLAKSYKYGSFDLIIFQGGSWEAAEYEEAYKEVSEYVTKVNNAGRACFVKGAVRAEMLTPKEQNQFNDTRCLYFHSWLVEKMLTADEIIVTKINVTEPDIHERINVWKNIERVAKIARVVSREMLQAIHEPGDYIHKRIDESPTSIFLKDYPIFEMGWTLPYRVQIIDHSYAVK